MIEEDGRNWLRRPNLFTKSCRAIIIIIIIIIIYSVYYLESQVLAQKTEV
jgi:hypothetical protein